MVFEVDLKATDVDDSDQLFGRNFGEDVGGEKGLVLAVGPMYNLHNLLVVFLYLGTIQVKPHRSNQLIQFCQTEVHIFARLLVFKLQTV